MKLNEKFNVIKDKKSVSQMYDFSADFHLNSPVAAILNQKDMLSIKPDNPCIPQKDEIQQAVRVFIYVVVLIVRIRSGGSNMGIRIKHTGVKSSKQEFRYPLMSLIEFR